MKRGENMEFDSAIALASQLKRLEHHVIRVRKGHCHAVAAAFENGPDARRYCQLLQDKERLKTVSYWVRSEGGNPNCTWHPQKA